MIEKIKLKYEENIVLIYPIIHMLIAMAIAYLVISFDTAVIPLEEYLPKFTLTSVSLARTILGALATSLLTITTFTFTTVMTVLTMYSSNYSPRLVESFFKEKSSLKVLGIFLGGFVYSIMSLLFMRDTMESDLVISATVGIIYAIVCCIYFIKFVSRVASSMQPTYLISSLSLSAKKAVESEQVDNEKIFTRENDIDFDEENCRNILSKKTGYIQFIDFDKIFNKLKDNSIKILVEVNEGDYIVTGDTIAQVINKEEESISIYTDEEEEMEIDELINKNFVIEDFRSESFDYRFSIQKIDEMAVRALSSGINDPFTAVECINALGNILQEMSGWENGYYLVEEDDKPARLYYKTNSFKDDLYEFFVPIINYGCQDLSVIQSIFNALKNMSSNSTQGNRQAIKQLAEYAYENGKSIFDEDFELEKLNQLYTNFQYSL